MNYQLAPPSHGQMQELIDIRLAAMRPSLEAVNRYEPERATQRFTDKYNPDITTCIVVSAQTVGFYVLADVDDYLLLDHLYLRPEFQGCGIGASIIASIKETACSREKPVRLGALRGSESNKFYQRHGFVRTHEAEFDIYYQFMPAGVTPQSQ